MESYLKEPILLATIVSVILLIALVLEPRRRPKC